MKRYVQKKEGSGKRTETSFSPGRKGFVLTLDAVIAATLALLMSIAIVNFTSVKSQDMKLPHSIAEDLLSSMDGKGELLKYPGYASQQIRDSMQEALQVLPESFCGNMTVRIFDANDFDRNDAYSESSCNSGSEAFKAKRVFADYTREKFGTIELEIRMK